MEPMLLFKHPRYHTYYVRFSRLERPPHGALVSLRKIVGYPVVDERKAKEILKELRLSWHKRKVVELSGATSITISELYASLRAEVDKLSLKSKNDEAAIETYILHLDNLSSDLAAAVDTLQIISNWGCNGQCVELAGTKCPCCIARAFLARMEVKNG